MNFLEGRTNRATYWLTIGILAALMGVLGVIAPSTARINEVVLVVLAVPRLHDVSRTGWWVLVAFGIEIGGVIFGFAAVPSAHFAAWLGVITLVILGLMAWLGAIPGTAGPNRFGERPPAGLQFGLRPRV